MSFFNWLCCCASVLITEVEHCTRVLIRVLITELEHCTKVYMGSLLIYSEMIADTKKWTQICANAKSSNFSAWIIKSDLVIYFHLSQTNALFLCPLKTPENLWFWGGRGYRNGTLTWNGLKIVSNLSSIPKLQHFWMCVHRLWK